MKIFAGYQLRESPAFLNTILQHANQIDEVYFSWGSQASGRSAVGAQKNMHSWEAEEHQRAELKQIADAGIGLNLLLNANCYGGRSLSRELYQKTGDLVDYLQQNMNLVSVTTTSPVMGKFLKQNFEGIEVKASVNMEIGTTEGMAYVADCFDAFYLRRELSRQIEKIKPLRRWCDDHGKKLHMLVNSGCLNNCSARQFHDNLVAHEQEIALMDNAFAFHGLCRDFMANPENRARILQYSNWIRPEDLHLYEELIDGVKLATRVSPHPTEILLAYLNGRYSGNILDLTEPSFSSLFYPEVLNAHTFGEEFPQVRYNCSGNCAKCGYCRELYQKTHEILGDVMLSENDIEQDT